MEAMNNMVWRENVCIVLWPLGYCRIFWNGFRSICTYPQATHCHGLYFLRIRGIWIMILDKLCEIRSKVNLRHDDWKTVTIAARKTYFSSIKQTLLVDCSQQRNGHQLHPSYKTGLSGSPSRKKVSASEALWKISREGPEETSLTNNV